MKTRLLALLAPAPAAIAYGLTALHVGPRPEYIWAHLACQVAFSTALVGVPAALVFVGLHALEPTDRRARLCVAGAVVNLAAVALFLLAAVIASACNVDTTGVFVFFSVFPGAAAVSSLVLTGARRANATQTRVR